MADTLTLDTAVHFVTARGGSGPPHRRHPAARRDRRRRCPARHRRHPRRPAPDRADAVHRPRRRRRLPRPARRPTRGARVLPRPRPGPRRRPGHAHQDVFTAWAHDRNHGWTRSCSPPPATSSPSSTSAPKPTAWTHPPGLVTAPVSLVRGWRTGTPLRRRHGHHPGQRPPAAPDPARLGQERRPLDRPERPAGDGSLAVEHVRTGHHLTLPAEYVTASVELGYATTIHGAQGISVDTMHGLATGAETRQQLYTMLTRGAERQPPLPAGRRRRRPARDHPPRQRPPPDRDRPP
jgi:hypothetical protein